ncbi:MAG: DMT family transporter [Desulfobulbus sp.]|jgi:drug/metabolite transporter (DMT)-like permease|uniref:DMT family transporter n=1 Tax=Desulfobulbus sp. TaxID=895 RepID=UPI00283FD740|nr:DMT family transporter [Desulfobulbus sp.]MDR2549876.1 DMT family transporter [Desulfobulbus sp.]
MKKPGDRPFPWWAIHGCMLISATLVATSFTVGKAITPFLDPAVLTLVRFVLAALLFAPYVGRRYGMRFPDQGALVRYGLISGALVGFFWLMFLSLKTTNPLNTGAIFTTVPGISGIYSWFLLKERLGRYRIAALLFAMAGALWVIFEGDPERVRQLVLNRGDLLFFCGCLLMALYMPLVKLFHRGEPMAVMTLWILITGCGWLLLFSATKLPAIAWKTVPAIVWYGIGYLAFFTTIVTFFISQWATIHLGPTRVMAYSYLYPPLIVLIEWFLRRDLPTLHTMLGIAIILPAMLIVQKKEKAAHP